MQRIACLTLAVALWPLGAQARNASDPDPWWGRDKALHLGVGAMIGGACYGTLWATNPRDSAGVRFAICSAFGSLPGLAKEIYDSGRPNNHFSHKDLFWTTLGVVATTLIMFGLEHLLRQPEPRRESRAIQHTPSGLPIAGDWVLGRPPN